MPDNKWSSFTQTTNIASTGWYFAVLDVNQTAANENQICNINVFTPWMQSNVTSSSNAVFGSNSQIPTSNNYIDTYYASATTTGLSLALPSNALYGRENVYFNYGSNSFTLKYPDNSTLIDGINTVPVNSGVDVDIFSFSNTYVCKGFQKIGIGVTQPTNNAFLQGNGSYFTSVTMSNDATLNGGALTLATVNSNTGTFGDYNNLVKPTYDGKGRATAVTTQPIVGASGTTISTNTQIPNIQNYVSNWNVVATAACNFALAANAYAGRNYYYYNAGIPGTNFPFTVLGIDNATAIITVQPGQMAVVQHCVNNVGAAEYFGQIINASKVNAQTGTTYTFALSDANSVVTANNSAASTYTLPQQSTTQLPVGYTIPLVDNIGLGTVTFVKQGSDILDGNTQLYYGASCSIVLENVSSTNVNTWKITGGTSIVNFFEPFNYPAFTTSRVYTVFTATTPITLLNVLNLVAAGTSSGTLTIQQLTGGVTNTIVSGITVNSTSQNIALINNTSFLRGDQLQFVFTAQATAIADLSCTVEFSGVY